MSSHHIVRENQEPALLVEDFHALSEEYLGQLLEWSPTIVTNPENVDYFLSQEIKVDILYGQLEDFYQEEIKRILPEKNFLEDALAYLISNNYKAVNIFATACNPLFLRFAKDINIVVFAQGIRYVIITSKYEKWKAQGQRMFIEVLNIKSFNGLKYLSDNTFEVEQDGFVVLEMNSDNFVFVGEEI